MHFVTPTHTTLALIPDGIAGIVETLKLMSRFVKEGKKQFPVRETALRLIRGCAQKDYGCEMRALHAFVRDQIRYVQDVRDVETVASAEKTLQYMAGDCDDKVVALGALLESIGHPTRFVAIGFEPGIFEHVYLETKIGESWIPLETTEPVEAGWEVEPRLVRARYVWHN